MNCGIAEIYVKPIRTREDLKLFLKSRIYIRGQVRKTRLHKALYFTPDIQVRGCPRGMSYIAKIKKVRKAKTGKTFFKMLKRNHHIVSSSLLCHVN